MTTHLHSTSIFIVFALVLFLVRWFLPAEATPEGTTLWVVAGWLILWPVWAFSKSRITTSSQPQVDKTPVRQLFTRPNLWLCALGMLVLGHILSGLYLVAFGEGNKRAALNMLWEWIGLGVSARLFWSWRSQFNWRPSLPLLLSCIAALAMLGLYQRFVFYPQIQSEYHRLVEAGDEKGLAELGIPKEEPARSQFLDRLLFSTEPFGFFALTNTFAGILGVGCLLWGGIAAITGRQKQRVWELFAWSMITFLSTGVSLFLTKSRTALAAFFFAFAVQGAVWLWATTRDSSYARFIRIVIVNLSLACVLGIAIIPQAMPDFWDGATKSLRYRFEYWDASWNMIQDSPLFGNLGNFRQEYLRYKLPESSEEISDPHNLIVDVWANGGFLSFLGIILLIGLTLGQLRNPLIDFTSDDLRGLGLWKSSSVIIGLTAICAFLVPVFLRWNYDERIVVIGLIWGGLFAVWGILWNRNGQMPDAEGPTSFPIPNVWLFAWLGLTIHLLGAGGMEMPAIAQLWLLLLLCAMTSEVPTSSNIATRQLMIETVLGLLLLVVFVWSTFIPVQSVRSDLADLELSNNIYRNHQYAQTAMQIDSLDPEPGRYLAYTTFLLVKEGLRPVDEFFKALEKWHSRDPHSASVQRQSAQWLIELSDRPKVTPSESEELKTKAVEHFQSAADLSPTNVFLWASLFQFGQGLLPDEKVKQAAENAIKLHEQNERLAHTDKLLPENELSQIRSYLNTH